MLRGRGAREESIEERAAKKADPLDAREKHKMDGELGRRSRKASVGGEMKPSKQRAWRAGGR